LQYELAVPLAMILVMIFLAPLFRELKLVSIYEYLEMRFDRGTRLVMSATFLLSRGLATGVLIYASGEVLSVCMGLDLWTCMLIVGVATIIYDVLGGMAAVVWSDVVQMVVLIGGVVVCIVLALGRVGGMSEAIAAHDAARLVAYDPGVGLGDGAQAPFWGFLIGGLCLYVSYYGVDQTQAQRQLCTPDVAAGRRSLVFNGLARFPLTVLYVVTGLIVGAYFFRSPELQAAIGDNPNRLMPAFIVGELPAGVRGVVIAAILAASMSSLDSTLNSMSASTIRDFVQPYARRELDGRRLLRWSRITTFSWGAVITLFGFALSKIARESSVVETINMIGSVFYGPILAAFLSGILDRRARGPAVIAGIALGVAANVALWQGWEKPVVEAIWPGYQGTYWMWLNATGLVVAALVTVIASRFMAPPAPAQIQGTTLTLGQIGERERPFVSMHIGLLCYFALIAAAIFGSAAILDLFR
ncbi:MAG TPA: sodium/solute symporter, partial [Kofleriaceae bacterium]|nr:sodium/solute symporter [Kofleriaceae bacterium]